MIKLVYTALVSGVQFQNCVVQIKKIHSKVTTFANVKIDFTHRKGLRDLYGSIKIRSIIFLTVTGS